MSEAIINAILRREGSAFTDHPADRGGPTKYGITQRAWESYRMRRRAFRAPEHVRDLTETDARAFYFSEYIVPWSWIMNSKLRELVIDSAVNHGESRAAKWLQEAAGVTVDGIVGPKTRVAVNSDSIETKRAFFKRRAMFYVDIVLRDNTQLVFLRGWMNRLLEFA